MTWHKCLLSKSRFWSYFQYLKKVPFILFYQVEVWIFNIYIYVDRFILKQNCIHISSSLVFWVTITLFFVQLLRMNTYLTLVWKSVTFIYDATQLGNKCFLNARHSVEMENIFVFYPMYIQLKSLVLEQTPLYEAKLP